MQKDLIEFSEIKKQQTSLDKFFQEIKLYKKIAVCYGNCQIAFLENIILKSGQFRQKYVLIRIPAVHLMDEIYKRNGIEKALLDVIDLFIYQEVFNKEKYGQLITEEIIKQLKPTCEKIVIPNCYFKGYHPQVIINERNVLLNSKYNLGGVIPYGDKILQDYFSINMKEDLLEDFLNTDCMNYEMIISNLDNTFKELEDREKRCNIIISDYIKENYQKEYLFFSPSHPCNKVLYELAKRILIKLELKENFDCSLLPENDKFEVPIYPVVFKILKLKFKKEQFYFCKTLFTQRDSLIEYAKKYKLFCFPELADKKQSTYYENTIDITYMVNIDTEYLENRLEPCMTFRQGIVHLSLYLTVKKGIPNLNVISIPNIFAPYKAFFTAGICENHICPIHINKDGRLKMNKPEYNSNILIIDTIWNI